MTHERIRSGRDYALLGNDFDGPGGEGIFLEHQKYEVETRI